MRTRKRWTRIMVGSFFIAPGSQVRRKSVGCGMCGCRIQYCRWRTARSVCNARCHNEPRSNRLWQGTSETERREQVKSPFWRPDEPRSKMAGHQYLKTSSKHSFSGCIPPAAGSMPTSPLIVVAACATGRSKTRSAPKDSPQAGSMN